MTVPRMEGRGTGYDFEVGEMGLMGLMEKVYKEVVSTVGNDISNYHFNKQLDSTQSKTKLTNNVQVRNLRSRCSRIRLCLSHLWVRYRQRYREERLSMGYWNLVHSEWKPRKLRLVQGVSLSLLVMERGRARRNSISFEIVEGQSHFSRPPSAPASFLRCIC